MTAYTLGVFFGVAVGIAIALFLLIISRTKHVNNSRFFPKYDERQQVARGKAFRIGFFSFLVLLAIRAVLSDANVNLPLTPAALDITCILLGCLLQVIPAILMDAYVALNEQFHRVLALFVLLGVSNLLIGIRSLYTGSAFTNGKLNSSISNLLCAFLFFILVLIMICHKHVTDKQLNLDENGDDSYEEFKA